MCVCARAWNASYSLFWIHSLTRRTIDQATEKRRKRRMTTTDPRSARTSRGTPGGRTPPAGAGASRPWPAPAAASSACLLPTAGAAPGRQRRPRRRRPSTARRRGAAAPWRSHHLCMHGSVHTIQEGKRRKAPVRSREQDARREVTSRCCTAGRSTLTFGHRARMLCSRTGGIGNTRGWVEVKPIPRVAVPEAVLH